MQPKEELFREGIMSPNVVDAAVLTMAISDSTVRNSAVYKHASGKFHDSTEEIYNQG